MNRHDFIYGFCWAVLLILAILFLTACAQTFVGICLAQGIGQTDGGIAAVAVRCEASQ